jgi:uncharacterized protein (DUF1330 family)
MSVYLISEANIRNREKFAEEFVSIALHLLKECHGEYLARGYENAISIRGAPPESNVMFARFPDLDLLQSHLKKIDPLIDKVGSKYADFRIIAIEGLPVNITGRQTT